MLLHRGINIHNHLDTGHNWLIWLRAERFINWRRKQCYWHNSHYQNLVSFGKYLWKQVDNNSRGYDQPRVMSPGLIAQGVTLYSCTSALPFDLGSYLPWLYIYWSFQIDWSIKTEEIGLAGLFVICPRHF